MQSPSATLQRHTAQQSEYRAMISALRAVLDASTSLQTYYLTPQTHSRLGAAHDQAQNLLQALFDDSGEPQLAAYLQTSRGSLLQVDAAAGHCSFSFNRPDGSCARFTIEDVTRASSTIQEFQRALLSIGAHLRSDRLLPLSQLLRESGFTFTDAQDATALARLIRKVEEQRACHRLNLRHQPALTGLMSDDDKAAIHDLIGDWLTGKTLSAIDSLASEVTPPFTRQQLEQQPAACLERLLDTPKARDLGQRLLQKLQWYGARPDEPTVPDIGLRLLLEALCLWYELPGDSSSTEVAGFALEQRAHHGASYASIRRDFLQHLEDSHRTSTPTEKHLLGWVCLTQFGLDFQVRDIPDDLPYASSVVWVNFVHGVHLAHALDPQLLEHLSFQQLVDLPLHKSENASTDLQTLIAMTRVAAAQTWTLATGAPAAASETSDDQPALLALEDHKKKLNAAILQLDIEPPRRLALAKQQLDKALANELYDHTTIRLKRHHPSTPNRSRRSIIDTPDVALPTWPLLEVYAAGGLSPDTRWYVSNDGRSASEWISLNAAGKLQSGFFDTGHPGRRLSRFPSNCTLPEIRPLFEQQFDDYLSEARKAYEYLIKSLLVTLPWPDRRALEHGEVRIHSLRDPTRHIEAHLETAENILPHRARMGFVLQATYQGPPQFYECLPRAGIIRKRPDLDGTHVGGLLLPPLPPKRGRTKGQSISRIVARRLPFDRKAHWDGSTPAPGAKCVAILEPLGDSLPGSMIPAAHHDSSPNLTFTSPRTAHIASLIATRLFYADEQALRSEAWGDTRFERDSRKQHWTHALKGFIPFWGSLEDLQSDSPGKRAMGVLGLLLDIVSFAIPLGKFVAGSIRLAAVAGKMAIRVALPRMAQLSKNLLVSSLRNLNPLDAAPALLKLGGRGAIGAVRAVAHLEHRAVARLKRLAGRSADYDLLHSLPQALDAGRWKALNPADHLAVVRGIDDVPVRNVGGSRHHLLDPLSDRPYGPQLLAHEHDFSLGRSHYRTVKKTDDQIDIEVAPNTRVELVPEAGGRTTVLIDDVPYRLDGDELRRVELLDDSQHWTLLPCRIRRAPGAGDCRVSYITAEPAPTPAVGTIDKEKGYAPWFGERVSEPATLPRRDGTFLAVEARLYQIIDNRPRLFNGDLRRLGFNQGRLVPRQQIQATLQFRKGIYARIKTGGTYDGIDDSHQVGAVLMPAIDDSATHVFFRVNHHEYYLATFAKGEIPGRQLTFKHLAPAELADGTLGAELLTVYTGSLHANNIVRIHGLESVQRAMQTMEQIAIPIGTTAMPANNMKWLKVDTSPGEALMFDHSTRMIVTRLPEGAVTWARSKEAPEAFRQKTAEIFDTLFLSPTINPANSNAALRIDSAMQKLHNLLPVRERPVNARNIAYAEVTTTSGKREIYVSVSGAQGSTQRLPLFRHMGANHVRIGDTTYVNIDYNPNFPRTSLEVTEQGQLLAVPLTIKELKTYQPTQTSRPTSLDSESKLISVLREKYPDPTEIRAVDIATTMRPCESCSVVMKQFGHDGGEAALQVLWG
ncbi:deaminase domain-containing protein [Pseudomonas sp. PS01299]|uniref:deaminase domain-containing protein n=1 Tax=Pseudomonas sp. PS01299 TaxID=2991435 RepID=UPI00249A8D07|nr:deaminase domain-containing protein [Pseudomonas sp. PS01299]